MVVKIAFMEGDLPLVRALMPYIEPEVGAKHGLLQFSLELDRKRQDEAPHQKGYRCERYTTDRLCRLSQTILVLYTHLKCSHLAWQVRNTQEGGVGVPNCAYVGRYQGLRARFGGATLASVEHVGPRCHVQCTDVR
jgi:hypothetical protein